MILSSPNPAIESDCNNYLLSIHYVAGTSAQYLTHGKGLVQEASGENLAGKRSNYKNKL